MNQRPFISTNLNIFDENRCIFSPSTIGGQPVMISQEQNRKICDTTTTAISSNQPRITNYCCPCQQMSTVNPPQTWSCGLQAQKQGIPGGVLFDFARPNYICPPTCIPSVYNPPPVYSPPPPPAPQIVECPYRTPQSICVDFGQYGLEAMMFQQKCRQQCPGFTYDKQVGTNDIPLPSPCGTYCSGTQSPALTVDQKEQLFHTIDETKTKQNLRIDAHDNTIIDRNRCICFPKPDPNRYKCAKTLVIGERKEGSCKDYEIVEQATREADAEAFLCCDCLDKWKKENECKRPSCLKRFNGENKTNADERSKKVVSFSSFNQTLIISESKENSESPSNAEAITQNTEKKTNDGSEKCHKKCTFECNTLPKTQTSEEEKCHNIRKITALKRNRNRLAKMENYFNSCIEDSLQRLDNEIEELRKSCSTGESDKRGIFDVKPSDLSKNDEEDSFGKSASINNENRGTKTIKRRSKKDQNHLNTSGASTSSENDREQLTSISFSKTREKRRFQKSKSNLVLEVEQINEHFSSKTTGNVMEEGVVEEESLEVEENNEQEASDSNQGSFQNETSRREDVVQILDEIFNEAMNVSKNNKDIVLNTNKIQEIPSKNASSATEIYDQPGKSSKVQDSPSNEKKGDNSNSVDTNKKLGEKNKQIQGKQDKNLCEIEDDEDRKFDESMRKIEMELDQLLNEYFVSKNESPKGKSSCNCCRCKIEKGVTERCEAIEEKPVYQPCISGRNPLSKLGNTLCNICLIPLEGIKNFLNYMASPKTPNISIDEKSCNEMCYKQRIDEYISQTRSRKICPCRVGTNKFFGRTCYDSETNQWYSCCRDSDQNLVQITFRENTERRIVCLQNTCRNSRYHVIYE